jgi:hypothetical protein
MPVQHVYVVRLSATAAFGIKCHAAADFQTLERILGYASTMEVDLAAIRGFDETAIAIEPEHYPHVSALPPRRRAHCLVPAILQAPSGACECLLHEGPETVLVEFGAGWADSINFCAIWQ